MKCSKLFHPNTSHFQHTWHENGFFHVYIIQNSRFLKIHNTYTASKQCKILDNKTASIFVQHIFWPDKAQGKNSTIFTKNIQNQPKWPKISILEHDISQSITLAANHLQLKIDQGSKIIYKIKNSKKNQPYPIKRQNFTHICKTMHGQGFIHPLDFINKSFQVNQTNYN
jgi:hypothetical protein